MLWDLPGRRQKGHWDFTAHTDEWALGFSTDSRQLAAAGGSGQAQLWDVASGQPIPVPDDLSERSFPPGIARSLSRAGAAVSLHDPRDGRVLATLLPVAASALPGTRPIELGDRPIELGDRPAWAGGAGEWFVTTPEGYFDGSADAARFVMWYLDGVFYPAERYLGRFHRPELVRRALRGERVAEPALSAADVPPSARFPDLKEGDPAKEDPLQVVVEARDDRDVREVKLFVNGRLLAPADARPIDVESKPIELGDPSAPASDAVPRSARPRP